MAVEGFRLGQPRTGFLRHQQRIALAAAGGALGEGARLRRDEALHQLRIALEAAVGEEHRARCHFERLIALPRRDADASLGAHAQRDRARAQHQRAAAALEVGDERLQHDVRPAPLPVETGTQRPRWRQHPAGLAMDRHLDDARALRPQPLNRSSRLGRECVGESGRRIVLSIEVDGSAQNGRLEQRIVVGDVEHAGRDARIAEIAFVLALFQHDHAKAAFGRPVRRGKPGYAGADDREIGCNAHSPHAASSPVVAGLIPASQYPTYFGSSMSMTSFTNST